MKISYRQKGKKKIKSADLMNAWLKRNTQSSERGVNVKMKTLVKEEEKKEKMKENEVSLDQKISFCSLEAIMEIVKEEEKIIVDLNCEKQILKTNTVMMR